MAGPDNANASLRELAERLALAAVGAAALTGDRFEELVDALAELSGSDVNRGLVLDGGRLAGFLSITDLARALETGGLRRRRARR